MQLDLTELGPDHLLYAIDYPYIQPDGAQKFLVDAPIDQEIKEKIGHGNAERLFHF
ncbi:amidohydrolase family protein [Secundilactobacillus hailunensis]|uniref:Amidohydrolase family protein n=1 Tax=Secundilactobacillus hailunensis TaxID=2559923 RepID=A0ABW1T695_9LACO